MDKLQALIVRGWKITAQYRDIFHLTATHPHHDPIFSWGDTFDRAVDEMYQAVEELE